MNYLDQVLFAEAVKFWINTITLGLFRLAVVVACVKYIWS